jgi:hypothetical protein
MTPEQLQPLEQWASQFNPAVWALATLALAIGWALSVIAVWARRRRLTGAVAGTSPESLQRAACGQALASTWQALDATQHHHDTLLTLQSSLHDWIKALQTDSGDLTVKSQLSAIQHSLDMAWVDLQRTHRTLHAEDIQKLNQQLSHLKSGGSLPIEHNAPPLHTPNPAESAQALMTQLANARQTLTEIDRWHDRPGSDRHQTVLAWLGGLDQQLQGVIGSLAQTIETLTETQRTLDDMQAAIALGPAHDEKAHG